MAVFGWLSRAVCVCVCVSRPDTRAPSSLPPCQVGAKNQQFAKEVLEAKSLFSNPPGNYPVTHLWKWKSSLKEPLKGDMLVPRSVISLTKWIVIGISHLQLDWPYSKLFGGYKLVTSTNHCLQLYYLSGMLTGDQTLSYLELFLSWQILSTTRVHHHSHFTHFCGTFVAPIGLHFAKFLSIP